MGQIYTKEKDGADVRYVDMCIYIDKTMKEWDPDHPLTQEQEEKVYKYLYLLYYSLSCKKHYFDTVDEYNSYSLYCATKAYVRLIDPRQFNLNENGEPEMARVKSILNYIKTTLFGWKVYWQKENFATVISTKYNKNFDPIMFENMLQDNANSRNKEKIINDVIEDINNIPRILHDIINDTPYNNDYIMCKRLYRSVILTFIYSIDSYLQLKNISKHYDKINNTVLWDLNEDMKPTVVLLFNKLKEQIKSNIKESCVKYNLDLNDIINSLWDVAATESGIIDE